MTPVDTVSIVDLAHRACQLAGLPASAIEPIRIRDNWMLRITGTSTVIRILPTGQLDIATRELRAADWLRSHQVLTAEPVVPDPVTVAGHPVTFWADLGSYGPAEPAATARALLRLHGLRVPTHLGLPRFALHDRAPNIAAAQTDDRAKAWLAGHSAELARRWDEVTWPDDWCVIHGDPSPHNTMYVVGSAYLVDLERMSIGPRQWDQATAAFQHDTLSEPAAYWEQFRDAYGHDVTAWDGYQLLRDIRSMELCLFALRHADKSDHARSQADYRLRCLMGRHGARPWKWVAP